MSHILSENILIFPSVGRDSTYSSGQYMTEYNLVNIINRLTDQAAFVITPPTGSWSPTTPLAARSYDPTEGGPFEFNMYGYYFRINPAANLTGLLSEGEGQYLNATINLKMDQSTGIINILPNSDTTGMDAVIGSDSSSVYTGLSLSVSDEPSAPVSTGEVTRSLWSGSGTATVSLTLLQKGTGENSYLIPQQSCVSFTQGGHLGKIVIDDGTL